MTRPVQALFLVGGVLVGFAAVAGSAVAQADGRAVIVVQVDATSLPDLLGSRALVGMAEAGDGGAALMVASTPGRPMRELNEARTPCRCSLGVLNLRMRSIDGIAPALREILAPVGGDEVVVIVLSTPPDVDPPQLGASLLAVGEADELLRGLSGATDEPMERTLTSDSTRRDGVVTSADVAATAIQAAGSTDLSGEIDGAHIEVIDGEPPIDLHERYLQSKRLTVPIGTAAALYAVVASLVAIIALWRPDVSPRHRGFCASLAISVPFLALSLLLAGHLTSLSYAIVIPFLVATTAVGTVALVPVSRRWGTLGAIAAAGVVLLVALIVEAALGWTAALTPLLGGSQLDGGRFFGLPNAFIGLLLGGSIYVAQRLPRIHGAAVIAAVGLFAGSPWTGSNFGAAVTLFAAAGIWWGLRGGLAWWRTAIAAIAAITAGAVLVVVAHRYLTSAATHITTFSENVGGVAGLWEKFVDRLSVGADLITSNPFALLPVIGVVLMLVVVLRPPGTVRATFEEAPVWRLALLTIVVASIVAYLVNDSGAAAVGEGLTTSLSAMLYVSLRRREEMMVAR